MPTLSCFVQVAGLPKQARQEQPSGGARQEHYLSGVRAQGKVKAKVEVSH